MVCFESHLNIERFRIARTTREMSNRIQPTGSLTPTHSHGIGHGLDLFFGVNEPLSKFLDFIAMHRNPFYTLLLSFIHTRTRIPADNDQVRNFQICAKVSLYATYCTHKILCYLQAIPYL